MKSVIAALALAAGISGAVAQDAAVLKDLAPTGKLRVGIAVGPAFSAIYTVKDASGQYRGVTIVLATELGKRLGVPVEFIPYLGSGDIIAARDANAWDLTFVPVDDDRRAVVNFAVPYHVLQSTYLVAPGSTIKDIADANKSGVRIAGVQGTATFRASNKASPNATHLALKGVNEAIEAMTSGKADAIALGRDSLTGLATKIPGSRILDGGILNSTTAPVLQKSKTAGLAYVSAFIEDMKATGVVRRAFDDVGLKGSQVAPPGMKP
jgi:polar amino acid transport system substrate-binding protein